MCRHYNGLKFDEVVKFLLASYALQVANYGKQKKHKNKPLYFCSL